VRAKRETAEEAERLAVEKSKKAVAEEMKEVQEEMEFMMTQFGEERKRYLLTCPISTTLHLHIWSFSHLFISTSLHFHI
jgi:hypothetical protein